MADKEKPALAAVSDVLETAAGYALIAVVLYAVIFMDITGGGPLWKTMRHVRETSRDGLESPNSTRIIKVPTQAAVEKSEEDRLFVLSEGSAPEDTVSAVYQAPDAIGQRSAADFADTRADPQSGDGEWTMSRARPGVGLRLSSLASSSPDAAVNAR